jgi:hypothetical protein
MHDRVYAADQSLRGCLLAETAGQPLDSVGQVVEAGAVASGPIPTAQSVTGPGQMSDQIATQKTGCARDGNPHEDLLDAPRLEVFCHV